MKLAYNKLNDTVYITPGPVDYAAIAGPLADLMKFGVATCRIGKEELIAGADWSLRIIDLPK